MKSNVITHPCSAQQEGMFVKAFEISTFFYAENALCDTSQ